MDLVKVLLFTLIFALTSEVTLAPHQATTTVSPTTPAPAPAPSPTVTTTSAPAPGPAPSPTVTTTSPPPKCGSTLYYKFKEGSFKSEISVKITFYDLSESKTDVTYTNSKFTSGESCLDLPDIPSNANLCPGGKIDVDLIDSYGDGWNGNEIRF